MLQPTINLEVVSHHKDRFDGVDDIVELIAEFAGRLMEEPDMDISESMQPPAILD